MEQQNKIKVKSKTTFLTSVNHDTETVANAATVFTSKGAPNISDSQVPIQNTENNLRTVPCDTQMGNISS